LEALLGQLTELIQKRESKAAAETERPLAASRTFSGIALRTIESVYPYLSEKVEISCDGGDDLFRELRIENSFILEDGELVSLKPGARLTITIETKAEDTIPKKPDGHA
jgi:hypothetical protein